MTRDTQSSQASESFQDPEVLTLVWTFVWENVIVINMLEAWLYRQFFFSLLLVSREATAITALWFIWGDQTSTNDQEDNLPLQENDKTKEWFFDCGPLWWSKCKAQAYAEKPATSKLSNKFLDPCNNNLIWTPKKWDYLSCHFRISYMFNHKRISSVRAKRKFKSMFSKWEQNQPHNDDQF